MGEEDEATSSEEQSVTRCEVAEGGEDEKDECTSAVSEGKAATSSANTGNHILVVGDSQVRYMDRAFCDRNKKPASEEATAGADGTMMAEEQKWVLEGIIVGLVHIKTLTENFDKVIKNQIARAAYRKVQRACKEAVSEEGHPVWDADYDHHLGATDTTHYGKPCIITLQDDTLTVQEGESNVLVVSLECVSVAMTAPGDLCRLVLVAAPKQHVFTLGPHAHNLVLILTVSSLLLLGKFLNAMCILNPKLRCPGADDSSSVPPPKPLRASQRKKSRDCPSEETQQLSEDEPPKLTRKLSQIFRDNMTKTPGSNSAQDPGSNSPALDKSSNTPAQDGESCAAEVSPNSNGHYPLRGQLSKTRAQDCNSGYYDEVPSGPPRKVSEAESEGGEELAQNVEQSV
nr:uncharacterized protein LOC128692032 [Cherax quadricarinatus]